MSPPDGFCAFILTNGRPHRVRTYDTLRRSGYTGPIRLLVDDLDKTKDEYISRFPDEVVVFDKKAIAKTFDQADNFNDMRAIIYARNASFGVAKQLGFTYFIQLDDDYTSFAYRFNERLQYRPETVQIKKLDRVFQHLLRFYIASGVDSLAIAQGGDFIGGRQNSNAEAVSTSRKCMNSFICSTKRPFKFVGRINEDVNAYTHLASRGLLMLTVNQVSLVQIQTQTNPGGMSELYLDSGTYVKSFYTVMLQPSSVKVRPLKAANGSARLHHSVSWRHTVPMILRESLRK